MARRTKKVGIGGRLGPRYGVVARRRFSDTASKVAAKYKCPRCNYISVKRESTGIWVCRHCGFKFAGGAYTPVSKDIGKMKAVAMGKDYSELKDLIDRVRAEMAESEGEAEMPEEAPNEGKEEE